MHNKKVLSKIDLGSYQKPNAYKNDIIYDPRGQWDHPGQNTRIPGGDITMKNVPYPVWAQPNVGPGTMMMPEQDYYFPGAEYVDEYPQMKKGGSKKGSKKYTRNIFATNKLFAESNLFKKPKKNQIFDPNASFYKDGGALLTKKVTCKKCGWTWNAADGGNDMTTCHKCGSQGLVHAQDGGAIYTYAGRPGSYYKKEGNKWLISNSGTGGKYVPVKDPDGTRTKALNKGATVIMSNPTPSKESKYDKVTPSYNKSSMVASVKGKTEAERKQVADDIEAQQYMEKMRQQTAEEQKNAFPQHEQPVDMMDYFWTGAVAAPVVLPEMGAALATNIPGTGISYGTALNTVGGIHGVMSVPDRIQDWKDVSSGKKTWQEATAKTLGTGLELYGGYDAAKKGFGLVKDIYDAGKGSNVFFNYSDEANAARELQDAGLLGKDVDPKIFGRYPNLAQNATKRILKDYNTTYRAVEPIVENMSIDDMVSMAKSGYDINDPMQVAEYMTTTVPIGNTNAYRAGLDLHPAQDAIYTGRYANAEEAARKLQGYGTHMAEVRPPMDFSNGNLNEWIENYYTNKLFGKIPAVNDNMFATTNPEAYLSGSKFKPGVVGFSRDSEFWPYIGNKGDKLLEAIRTTKIRKDGGEYFEMELTPEEINEYKKGGFIVEDISIPSLNQMAKGGPGDEGDEDVEGESQENFLRNWFINRQMPTPEGQKLLEKVRPEAIERASQKVPYIMTNTLPDNVAGYYDTEDENIYLNQNYPSDQLNSTRYHEKLHHVQGGDKFYKVLDKPHQYLVEQNIKSPEEINTGNSEWDANIKANYDDIIPPEEMHARIMTLRRLAGFKPDQVITEKDVEDYFKKAGENLDPDIQDIKQVTKGTKSIVELLNHMAANKGPSRDDMMDYAKKGGIVTSLTQKQINQYIKDGYMVEELD